VTFAIDECAQSAGGSRVRVRSPGGRIRASLSGSEVCAGCTAFQCAATDLVLTQGYCRERW
jgi:hypothetical protein